MKEPKKQPDCENCILIETYKQALKDVKKTLKLTHEKMSPVSPGHFCIKKIFLN